MLFVPNWLLAQARFCGRTHLPPSPNSNTPIGQGDIPIITLLILSSAGRSISTSADTEHLWAWWHFGNHLVDIIPGQMQLSQHPSIHSTRGHGDISAITLLILSLARCSCLNIRRYTAPVGMMTFRQSPCWYYRGVMVKAMNCGIAVREFVLQSRYYVHFRANTLGKGMNPLILPPAMGK